MKDKYILLLGASSDQLFIIKTAKNMGLKTIVLDGNKNAPGLKVADISANIDFSNLKEVFNYIDSLKKTGKNICGVTTMGSDVPHLIAEICEYYNWNGPSMITGQIATDKYLMKERFQDKQVPIPLYSKVNNSSEIINIWNDWEVDKIIIKPTDRAGSRGVRIISNINDIEDINNAFEYAFVNSKTGNIIIEEYIDGIQISTESIVYNNQVFTPGFADRVYDNLDSFSPNIMENGGWVPSSLDKQMKDKVLDVVEKAVNALEINNWVAKGDIVIDKKRGPIIIEMAARLSGGDFCESLVPLGCGINYVESSINLAINEKVDIDKLIPTKNKYVANRYFFPPPGILEEITGKDEILDIEGLEKLEFFYDIGDKIPKINSHGERAGVFVITGDDKKTVQDKINFIYNTIKFRINKNYYTGSYCDYNKK